MNGRLYESIRSLGQSSEETVRRYIEPSVWRRGSRLWCSLVEVYYPEGGKSWTLGPTPLKG